MIWPGDLVFDLKWPSFELDLEIIKTNILNNIYEDYFKNVTSRVLEIIKTNILSKIHNDYLTNVTSRVLLIFSFDLT